MQSHRCMKDLPIFSTLNADERNRIGELAGKKLYRKGEHIFHEGEPADTIYLIKYGRIKLYKVSPGGKEVILSILASDDMFGENTFFDHAQHTLHAQALEDTYICSCNREHFALLLQNPGTALKIIQLLGEKLNSYSNQVASIAFQDVKGRVSATLLRLAGQYGVITPEGTAIDIELTHYDLAALVNASRVMVSNVIGDLRNEGAIANKGHRFILLDTEKLNVENTLYRTDVQS